MKSIQWTSLRIGLLIGDIPLLILFCFFILFSSVFYPVLQHRKIHLTFIQTYGVPRGLYLEDFEQDYNLIVSQKILEEELRLLYHEIRILGSTPFMFDSGHEFFQFNENLATQLEKAQSRSQIMRGFPFVGVVLRGRHLMFGLQSIADLSQMVPAPFLSSNLREVETNQTPLFVKPYQIIKIKGEKVGVIGLSNSQLLEGSPKEMTQKLKLVSSVTAVKESLAALKKLGVKIVVLLSSLSNPREEEQLVTAFSGQIQLVLSHCQRDMDVSYFSSIENTPITHMPCHGPALGRVDLWIEPQSRKIQNISHQLYSPRRSEDLLMIGEEGSDGIAEDREYIQNLGTVVTPLFHYYDQESEMGNFVTDTLLNVFGVDGVVINSGTMKGVPSGLLSIKNLYDAIPFQNRVVTFTLKGFELKSLIEESMRKRNGVGILQMAGIRVRFSLPHEKLESIEIKGRPLQLDHTYHLASIEYLLNGGDGYEGFKKAQNREVLLPLKRVLIQHIREIQEVHVRRDDRIKFISK